VKDEYEQQQNAAKRKILRQIPILVRAKRQTLNELITKSKEVTKPFQAYLFRQGDPITHWYITQKGDFKVFRKVEYVRPQIGFTN
jgi:CRP-like cAMP-binding protein